MPHTSIAIAVRSSSAFEALLAENRELGELMQQANPVELIRAGRAWCRAWLLTVAACVEIISIKGS